jgi:CBS domain-containing protein
MSAEEFKMQTEFEPASKAKENPEFCQVCNEKERFEIRSKRVKEKINDLLSFIKTVQVFEVTEQWERPPPVTVYIGQTIKQALELINKFHVFSLPVLNTNDHMIGLVDVLDIVKELIANCFNDVCKYDEEGTKKFLNTQIDLLFLQQLENKRSKSYCTSRHTACRVVIREMMLKKRERFLFVDRVVPGDIEEQPWPEVFFQGIISTADILRFFCKYPTWIKREPYFDQKISEVFETFREPTIVNLKDITSRVFSKMTHKSCRGVAIVDDEGKLVANVSPSDLRGITLANCYLLNSPLKEFFDHDKSHDWWFQPIVVDLNASLYQTMQTFVCTRVHRMYVVNEAGKPIGEINHRDLLRHLLIFDANKS